MLLRGYPTKTPSPALAPLAACFPPPAFLTNTPVPVPAAGRNMIGLSDPLCFFAPQRDSGRKKIATRKISNPGSFWFTAIGGSFFLRHKNFSLQPGQLASLALEWQKWCTTSPCFVSSLGYLFYPSGYTTPAMYYQQANAIQTTYAGAWPVVWLIW